MGRWSNKIELILNTMLVVVVFVVNVEDKHGYIFFHHPGIIFNKLEVAGFTTEI